MSPFSLSRWVLGHYRQSVYYETQYYPSRFYDTLYCIEPASRCWSWTKVGFVFVLDSTVEYLTVGPGYWTIAGIRQYRHDRRRERRPSHFTDQERGQYVMTADRSSRLPRFRAVPTDLVAIFAVTILLNVAVFAPGIRETPLRVPLGLLFVFFVPGYALVATLFPERDRSAAGTTPSATTDESLSHPTWETTINGLERLVLSFGLSVAIVPGFGLLLNYTSWGIQPVSILAVTTAFTVLLTGTAIVRRLRLSPENRFHISVWSWGGRLRTELSATGDRSEMAITVALIASVVLAGGGIGYAVTTPYDSEQFSAVYLLTEDGDELVADDYPTAFEGSESQDVIVGIDNNEHRTAEYTVVAVEQETESADGETVVTDQQEIDRFETQLDHEETWQQAHEIEPTIVGENVRIAWLVYLDGDVPDDPTTENAPYHVHVWVDVDEPDGGS